MRTEIFNGKKTAEKIYQDLLKEIVRLKQGTKVVPKLTVVLLGKDPGSKIYIREKKKACDFLGIECQVYELSEKIKQKELLELIQGLNKDKSAHAILVQLPLPKHINQIKIMSAVSAKKDADGFNPVNLGNALLGKEALAPCTPKAVIKILKQARINVQGKNIVIINHSNIVGKPLSLMLLNRGATTDVCHKKTKDLKEHTNKADILISGAGVPGLIKGDMIKQGAILIDVGISRRKGKIYGDVDFESVKNKACFLTPVPGGVGPVTVAMLMENTFICYKAFLETKLH